MVEHDGHVGQLLAKLKELGLDQDTIVMYSTDNGSESFSWPDGGTAMFRGEKATQWEGGYRVPTAIRWPGVIKPGTIINEVGSHEDMLPTLLAAAGDTGVTDALLKGRTVGSMTYKVHIDGYNLLPALRGQAEWPRKEFLYWTDDGSVAALRYGNWKATFLRQDAHGLHVWREPFVALRPSSRTCARTRSSWPTRSGWTTTAGLRSTCSWWRLRPPTSGSGCRVSASSRRGRSPAASTSTT
jgi:arylsulfatase